jgi:hypothetical protein
MSMPIKVYHWITWIEGEQVDVIVASRSSTEACRIGGLSHGVYDRLGSVATKREAIDAGLANPGVALYVPLDELYAPGPTVYREAGNRR